MVEGGVAKPVLRGLHNATIKRNLIVSFGLCTVLTLAYKFIVNDSRKAAYADFYKTYDAQKSFDRMKNAGIFNSCK